MMQHLEALDQQEALEKVHEQVLGKAVQINVDNPGFVTKLLRRDPVEAAIHKAAQGARPEAVVRRAYRAYQARIAAGERH